MPSGECELMQETEQEHRAETGHHGLLQALF